MIKKWLTRGNILNALFFAVILILLFVPAAKALLIRGLMQVGLFQPDVADSSTKNSIATDVVFHDVRGRQFHLESLKGKVVFINFWATWCPPCLAEMPAINEMHTQLKADTNIVVLAVDTDSDLKKSAAFMAKHQYNLPVYATESAIPQTMAGSSIPATVVINKKGQIVFRHDGTADYSSSKFIALLKRLSAE
ncbi:hypothetical protein GCM10023149_44130 [Mucilaginibacter gynuensis]|uniref:Thioredoxin domain-containing protein n=1 Tax=Mucilaginibacter gynuensis TaxID=1302236 RepID=A0ABP8H8H4_9SPHI